MDPVARFAQLARERLGSEICRIKGRYPARNGLDGELVFLLLGRKEIEIREKIFKLISEIPGEKGLSFSPLIYSSFEYRENCSMKSAFAAWLETEGEEF